MNKEETNFHEFMEIDDTDEANKVRKSEWTFCGIRGSSFVFKRRIRK